MTPLVKDIIMSSTRMPALFLGHGSPMNVLEDNLYTRSWLHTNHWFPCTPRRTDT